MLPRWYPNSRDKSDGNFIERHISCIATKINVCVLFVKGLENPESQKLIKSEKKEGFITYIRYFKQIPGWPGKLINPMLYFYYLFLTFFKIRKEMGFPALCHVHVMARTSVLANYLNIFYNIPFMVSEHWSGYYKESGKLSPLKKLIYRLLFKRAGSLTAVSDSLLKTIENQFPVKGSVIPNVVLDVFFTKIRNPEKGLKKLIHISNLHNQIKQCDKMLIYLNELAEKRKDFEFIIAGDGPDRQALEQLTLNLKNLHGKVFFKGDVTPDELAGLLSKATATLSFSKFETQSVVLLESIAMAVPVVAPDTGGIPEHCHDKGILFKVNSKEGFLQAVENMLENNSSFDAETMRNYARQNFSADVLANKFLNEYRKLIPEFHVQ